jgi:hypothetical protein
MAEGDSLIVLAVSTGIVVIVVAVAVVLVVLFVSLAMRGRQRSEAQRRGEARQDVSEAQERADWQRERGGGR